MTATLTPGAYDWVPPPAAAPPRRSSAVGLLRGRPDDAAWVRPALLGLLVATGVLYVWNLGASGWANSFYAAAVQAGTKSWKAFLFGSFDPSNFITVDKTPASLWVMELSARIFGLNSWSMLVPQALEGVATVGVVYLAMRRWFSAEAALAAGVVTALTPVAALMFKFNNPDALLVLLLTLAVYATVRAVDDGRTGWVVLAGALVGVGFLTKELQAFLVVPAVAAAYLYAGPGRLRRRLVQLLYGGVGMVVAAGWWVLAVQLTPAADRPYIGGSQNNSLWNVVFGYNGFGRLTGNEAGSVGGGPAGTTGRWGATGLIRLFGSEMGTQVSWLLPAALILLVAGLYFAGRAPRTDRTRAALVLWGGTLVVTGAAFSLGQGIIHPYYTVALAPAIGAVIGVGGQAAARRSHVGRGVLAAALLATGVWAFVLLDRTPTWLPWLRPAVLAAAVVAASAVAAWPWVPRHWRPAAAAMAAFAALAAPAAYTFNTVSVGHTGAIPSAGPVAVGFGGPGGGPGRGPGGFGGLGGFPGGANRFGGTFAAGGPPGGFGGAPAGGGGGAGGGLLDASTPNSALTQLLSKDAGRYTWVAAAVGANRAAGYQLATGDAVMAIGGFNGTDPYPSLAQFQQLVREGKIHYFISGGGFGGRRGPAGGFGSPLGNGATGGPLANGSTGAGPFANGGFPGRFGGRFGGGGFAGRFGGGFGGGQGGAPGQAGGGPGGPAQSASTTAISNWVAQNFTASTVGGVTVYDLTAPTSTGSPSGGSGIA